QLNAIRERAERATPGPWVQINGTDVFTELNATNNARITADNNDGWQIADTSVGVTFVNRELTEMESSEQFDNATFISAAREDVPMLLAEIERLREAIEDIA